MCHRPATSMGLCRSDSIRRADKKDRGRGRNARRDASEMAPRAADEPRPASARIARSSSSRRMPTTRTIGCGGLIAQAARSGDSRCRRHPHRWIALASRLAGLRSNATCGFAPDRDAQTPSPASASIRPASGFWSERDSELPAGGPAAVPLVAALRRRIEETRAAAVFVTWIDDPHCDHQAAFALAIEAAGPVQATLYAYPVWSWTVDLPEKARTRARCCGSISDASWTPNGARSRVTPASSDASSTTIPRDSPLSDTELALFVQRYETFIAVVHPPKI